MKGLKKLALVSAIAMTSVGAFAMEAVDDETLSAATGQDGITILVSPGNLTVAQLQALGVTNNTINSIGQYSSGTDATAGTFTPGTPDGSFNPAAADDRSKGLSIRQVVVHDDDGLNVQYDGNTASGTFGQYLLLSAGAGNRNSGALVIGGVGADGTIGTADDAADSTVVFAKGDAPIVIDIDNVGSVADAGAGAGAQLNVRISTPKLGIKMGAQYVANSNAAAANNNDSVTATGWDKNGVAGGALAGTDADGTDLDGSTPIKIMNGLEVILGATSINIQLGRESANAVGGAMIAVNATVNGGLTINNLETLDQGGVIRGGGIYASSLSVVDNGGTDLTAVVYVNAEDNLNDTNPALDADIAAGGGLVVTLAQLGNAATGIDLTLNDQKLGASTAAVMGDIQIKGLQLAGTSLIIRGH